MKKWMLVGAAAVGLLGLAGCGSKKEASDDNEKTEIKYFSYSATPDFEKQLNEMVKAFEEENPTIKVNVEMAPFDTYFTKLQTLLAGGKAPDVFEMNYENFVSYANKGKLLDLTDRVEKDKDLDLSKVNTKAFDAYKYKGKQLGLTESFSNVVTIYNKDMFDKAGISYPAEDWKWEDEIEAAEKLTNTKENIYGTYSPVTMNEFFKVAAQNGGQIYDEKGKLTIDSSKNVEALQHMVDLVDKYKVSPSPAEMSGQKSEDLFMNGQLGMVHTGIWMFGQFKDAPFNWDIQVEAGNTQKATHFFAEGLVVSKETKEADAAYKFSKFMSIGEEAAKIRVDNSWNLPISNDKTILDTYLKQTPPENRQAVFNSLDYLILPPVTDNWAKLSDAADQEFQNVLLGKETAKEALEKLQKQFE
ncbi:MAG: sugar ABC transporter substrate-binding protein [Lactobacillales bacterium]|jgi:multiple sugar transport system substrate-binding protein|nr:sugar ABC transporter substrate-binding protein [Lactobacillales bacterium]